MEKEEDEIKKFEVPRKLFLSWILTEIRESVSDHVNIVCKDHESVQASALLLSAMAPNFAKIFNTVDIESCVILIPDVQADSISHLIDKTFNMGLVTDELVLEDLTGIFWKTEVPIKDEKGDVVVEDGPEVEEVIHHNVEEINNVDFVKCEVLEEDARQYSQQNGTCKNESEEAEYKPGKRRKRGIKRTAKGREKSSKRKKKKVDLSESDNDLSDTKLEDDFENFDNDLTMKKGGGRSSGNSSYVPVLEEDVPKDENFVAAQGRLKEALLDENNHVDPAKLWFEFHGHNLDVRFSELQPKLICPICMLSFSLYKKGLIFFLHLQRHKYQNFKCACLPRGRFNVIRKHIQVDHWTWPQCHICSDVVDPDKMPNHLRHKHGQVNETSVCTECGSSFPTGKNREFRMHMEYHRAENFSCDCEVIFKSKLQKVHHIQVEHVKEMLGCKKCFFVCLQESTLKEHVKRKHHRTEETENDKAKDGEDPSKRLICDICGYECKSNKVGYLERHKARMHDPVLLDCPHCPAKFNASAMKQHIFNTHDSNGICNICGAQVKNIKRHMKNMHQPKHLLKYKCQYCDRAFQWAQDIKKHVMNVHLKERPYKCRYGCEVAYNDSSNRNQHEKRKHGCIYSAGQQTFKDENR